MRPIRISLLVTMLLALSAVPALAGGGNSDAAHACQNGGYAELVGSGGETFSNTGECVSFAAHGGTFATEPPPDPNVIVVPAGATVTFDNPTLAACNQLSWGFTVNSMMTVVGGKPSGCGSEVEGDSTFGPFATTVELRVLLIDHTCANTFYFSDGDHARTLATSATSWAVDIADGGPGCSLQNVPAPFVGEGNLSVDVVVNP